MGVHFTYSDSPSFDSLRQGDVLRRTAALLEVMRQVHPHYASDEYLYYQVLTQSCDLVPRNGGGCKARYITLAAVRSVRTVIDRKLESLPADDRVEFDGVRFMSDANKFTVTDFIGKLLNNQSKEYFFLRNEPTFDFNDDCCTFLYLSVAVRSREHYEACLNAKVLELEENFQSRLGWMVGNLYSRVGTRDYADEAHLDGKDFDDHLKEFLEDNVNWVSRDRMKYFRTESRRAESVKDLIDKVVKKNDEAVDQRIAQIAAAVGRAVDLDKEARKIVRAAISNDPALSWLKELAKG